MYQLLLRLIKKPIELMKWMTNEHGGRLFPDPASRNDLTRIPIDNNSYIEVFWKMLEYGRGPAVSFFIKEEEILRVDCSGSARGHLHAAFFYQSRERSDYSCLKKIVTNKSSVQSLRFVRI